MIRGLAAAAVATLFGIALLIGLGVWQLQRLAWKEGLIAAVESRVGAAPVDLPPVEDWDRLNPSNYEYRHVRLTGVYDYSHQALVFRSISAPRARYEGVGYLVMTPLKLADGGSVIVNRGFVPEQLKAAAAQGPAGEVTVTGLMRSTEGRTWFTPADDPGRGQYFTRDVTTLARAMDLGPHAPFTVDADASAEPLPEGGETVLSFPNNHLSYAATWFGMALALIGVFGVYAYGQIRGAKADRPAPRRGLEYDARQ